MAEKETSVSAALCIEARDWLRKGRRLSRGHYDAIVSAEMPESVRTEFLKKNAELIVRDSSTGKKILEWETKLIPEEYQEKVQAAYDKKISGTKQRRGNNRITDHYPATPENISVRDELHGDLAEWIRFHGGEAFDRPWSDDHLKIIAKIEQAITGGGLFAMAMPRGHGKTTILKWALLFALLSGKRKYVVAVAGTAKMAQDLIDFCRQQITENDSLYAQYPHVCHYARETEGKAIKAKYMLRKDGSHCGIEWGKERLIFPDVDNYECDSDGKPNPANGAILEGHGLTGAIRGKWKDSKTGKVIRPDFVMLDDPQTRESGESDSQCDMRERIITGDVLGLAGPRKRIAAVMPCTVIRKGDLAARFLDHNLHPEWQGETCKLVYNWPEAQETLWAEYRDIYRSETGEGRGFGAATQFYLDHREEMDFGAVVSWEHRIRDGEVSALQTAENLLIETGMQFWAEYQNDPPSLMPEAEYVLKSEHIVNRTNGLARGKIDEDAILTVACVDLNRIGASWMAVSTTSTPAYSVIDYDRWLPPGRKELWFRGDKDSIEKAIATTCEQVTAHILGRSYGQRIDAICIDAGSDWARVVHEACKMLRQVYPAVKIYSAKGASGFQYDPPQRMALIRQGFLADVRLKAYGTRQDMFMYWDSSYWHMASQQGWLAGAGSMGAVTVYGEAKVRHQKLAEECAASVLQCVEYRGDKKQAKFKSSGPEHWGDCLAVAMALLSVLGVFPTGAKERHMVGKGERTPATPVKMDSQEVKPQEVPAEQKPVVRPPQTFRRAPAWQRW
jgi:hypothetical protein